MMNQVSEQAKAATNRICRMLPDIPEAKVWDAIYEAIVAAEKRGSKEGK